MLNRSALIVRPLQPYIDWAKGLDDSGLFPEFEGEQTVYLIPEVQSEQDETDILKIMFAEIFERELFEWHTDEADWPKRRTFAMFKKWFKVEIHTVVEDLCRDPIEDDTSDA
jgi:hypothetical protein